MISLYSNMSSSSNSNQLLTVTVVLATTGPVRYPDLRTLSIIETWPQKSNYFKKIEHFSRLVAAELVFPQLPDVWAALSLLNIFPSRPLTPFTCIAGTP